MVFDVVDFGLLDSSSPVDSYCPLLFPHRLSAVWGDTRRHTSITSSYYKGSYLLLPNVMFSLFFCS